MEVIDYNSSYAQDFKNLNIDWLKKYFYVEPHDEEVLSNPETYIINPGGHIFFIKSSEEIIGTVALIKITEGVFELSKMAITPEFQGRGLGQKLMKHCIAFAKANAFKKLILYSNTKLENAIYIYRKWGFAEIPLEENGIYDRGNIKMELPL